MKIVTCGIDKGRLSLYLYRVFHLRKYHSDKILTKNNRIRPRMRNVENILIVLDYPKSFIVADLQLLLVVIVYTILTLKNKLCFKRYQESGTMFL